MYYLGCWASVHGVVLFLCLFIREPLPQMNLTEASHIGFLLGSIIIFILISEGYLIL